MAPWVPEHVAHVLERLSSMGVLEVRRLFSGLSLYCDDVIFALVFKEQIYLKVDDETRPAFQAEGMQPFQPRSGKKAMPYFTLPDQALDDDDELLQWARLGLDAGLRDQARKAGKEKRGP
ncbi:MAG: TfoX/Sxy family protein [Alphaproteobacteria bacterium]|nr:TfoX/Sxy family protein [Alphaproteobacteria bacterium]